MPAPPVDRFEARKKAHEERYQPTRFRNEQLSEMEKKLEEKRLERMKEQEKQKAFLLGADRNTAQKLRELNATKVSSNCYFEWLIFIAPNQNYSFRHFVLT